MPFKEIWLHIVWTTKYRNYYLTQEILHRLIAHMFFYARKRGIRLVKVNGAKDHLHVLIILDSTQRVSEIVRYLKGESARWINRMQLTKKHFSWQNGYYVKSISPEAVGKVKRYIQRQGGHHEGELG